MTMAYSEFVTAIRSEGQALLAAAGQGGDDRVPTCDDWTVDDLLRHIGRIWGYVATIVGERLTAAPDKPEIPADRTPHEFATEELDELVDALMSCDQDTPMWNWAEQPQTATFWARRMAHEAAVHRYDAQTAHDVAQPIEAALAHDGLDELVDVILPRIVSRDAPALPDAVYAFVVSDEEAWCVQLGREGVTRADAGATPDVTVRGTPSELLLAALNRVEWSTLDVEGDAPLLDAWAKALHF